MGKIFAEEIEISDDIHYLTQGMFEGSPNLKSVKFTNSMKSIVKNAFFDCPKLEQVIFPKGLTLIGEMAFWSCTSLKELDFPQTLSQIDDSAFSNCVNLSKFNIPPRLVDIGKNAFNNTSIENLDLPDTIINLGEGCFSKCSNLKKVRIGKSITKLKDTFCSCGLREVKLSQGINNVDGAFAYCPHLTKIEYPQSVKKVTMASFGCDNLEEVSFSTDCKYMDSLNGKLKYITKQDDRFILSKEKINEESKDISFLNGLHVGIAILYWDNMDILLSKAKNTKYIFNYNKFFEILPEKDFKNVFENGNFKHFNSLDFQIGARDKKSFYTFCYNLGALKKEQVFQIKTKSGVKEKIIDYAQKVCEFLKEVDRQDIVLKIKKKRYRSLYGICKADDMKVEGFKKEFTDFFLENFEQLLKVDQEDGGFIVRCYNNLEQVQNSNTSNKGSQRQLKPTIEKFKDYFTDMMFVGEDESNKDIASAIKPYTKSQQAFDNALSIMAERERLGTPTRILKEHLTEQGVFEAINFYSQKIDELMVDSRAILTELADKIYTYDFLEKDDPRNLVLGKNTSCCAHLEGNGYGIMKASMVNPDVQNIAILDSTGKIVAKTTMYVNRDERYALCNTFSIRDSVSENMYPFILYKFKKAVSAFAYQYNNENPQKPLVKINVGMGMNSLEDFLEGDGEMLKNLNYRMYGIEKKDYPGDAQVAQSTIWHEEEINI